MPMDCLVIDRNYPCNFAVLLPMSEFSNVDFEDLLYTYKQAIDINMIASVTDERGTILYVNKKFCEVSKFSSQELVGQNHRIVNSGHHSKEFFAHLWTTIRTGNVWHGEIKNKAKDGGYYWVDTVILPISTAKNKQFLSLRKEITERKELERKKEEYLRSLEELFFMTSHEIRRPVCTILGLLELQTYDFSKEDLKKILDNLKPAASDLDKFTRELNDYLANLKEKLK